MKSTTVLVGIKFRAAAHYLERHRAKRRRARRVTTGLQRAASLDPLVARTALRPDSNTAWRASTTNVATVPDAPQYAPIVYANAAIKAGHRLSREFSPRTIRGRRRGLRDSARHDARFQACATGG